MLIAILFQGVPVGATGTVNMGPINAPSPGLHFVCEGGGVMKGIGSWTTVPQVSVGALAPAYAEILPATTVPAPPFVGANKTEPALHAYPSGTSIFLNVLSPGAVALGTPKLDVYIVGVWVNLTVI